MTDALGSPDLPQLLEHRAWVRALARRLCADENDVDDVEQETWTVAIRRRPDEPRALRSWLGVVASRLALQRIRGESRRVRREEAIAAPEAGERSTADVVATADAHGHVVHAVLALDEPYRTTVLLRYFEGLEIADVARRMSVPLETVRTRLKRAHERLRATLAPDDDRALLLLLVSSAGKAASATAVATGAAASFAHAAAVVACVVAVGAGGAWLLTSKPDADGAIVAAKAPVLAAVPPVPSPGADGADGSDGADGTDGTDGAPGQDGEPGKPGEPASAPQEKPAAPLAAGDPWIAYDLADGRAIAGLKLVLTTWTVDAKVTTDSEGRVATERAKVNDITVEPGSPWHFAKPLSDAVKNEPSLWFWRERPVTGTVASADPAKPLDPGAVRLTWVFPYTVGSRDEPGRGVKWMNQHGLYPFDERTTTVRAGAGGRVSGAAPAIRGAMLTAEADGFTPATVPLVWDADGVCALTIVMSPTLRIVGRVLDAAGEPLVGEPVQLNTSIVTTSDDEAARAMAMNPRGGYTFAGKSDHGLVALIRQATTDARGVFSFDAPAVGTNVVLLLKPGFLACRKEFGATATDAVGFDLRLVRSEARVLVRVAGKPLASGGMMANVEGGGENGFSLSTDADGRMDPGWLQRGRWYRLAYGEWNVCFRWDGQTELDLDQLPKEPTKDK